MKKFATIIISGAITLAFGATAQAGENEVTFTYNPDASASVTYETLQTQARKVCDAELGPLKHYGAKDCMRDYVGQIVEKIGRPDLTALYMRPEDDRILMTELDTSRFEKK